MRRPYRSSTTRLVLALFLGSVACHGDISKQPPVHLNPNMDNLQRFDPQEPNPMFEDGRAMRTPPEGTIAVGSLKEDSRYWHGRDGEAFTTEMPVEVTAKMLDRGQQRFNIYCSVCHDRAGTGQGIAVKRGMLPPPSFHTDRVRQMPLGQLFDTISQGVRNMPAYGAQIPEEDRWAIVAYVRALQLSQNVGLDAIPPNVAQQKGWKP